MNTPLGRGTMYAGTRGSTSRTGRLSVISLDRNTSISPLTPRSSRRASLAARTGAIHDEMIALGPGGTRGAEMNSAAERDQSVRQTTQCFTRVDMSLVLEEQAFRKAIPQRRLQLADAARIQPFIPGRASTEIDQRGSVAAVGD